MPDLSPLRLLLLVFAGLVHRDQVRVIEYLVEENRTLRSQLAGSRLRLGPDQRRRLAVLGRALGRKVLTQVATIVTPDTILRWHRQLVAAKWTTVGRRRGRPVLLRQIRELIVRMATDNARWGYCRIQGELKKVGHRVARSTIAKTLRENGIAPSPDRPTSWRTFLKAHAEVIAATDFFTAEVWTARGLVTHYVLFVVHHATRAVQITGITTNPDAAFMAQVARNLIDPVDGFLRGKRFLIADLDTKFNERFREVHERGGVRVVRTAYQAPNMNAIAERWMRSVKSECLDRMVLFGEDALKQALQEYGAHFHQERPHQGLGNTVMSRRRVRRSRRSVGGWSSPNGSAACSVATVASPDGPRSRGRRGWELRRGSGLSGDRRCPASADQGARAVGGAGWPSGVGALFGPYGSRPPGSTKSKCPGQLRFAADPLFAPLRPKLGRALARSGSQAMPDRDAEDAQTEPERALAYECPTWCGGRIVPKRPQHKVAPDVVERGLSHERRRGLEDDKGPDGQDKIGGDRSRP
ncbi:MAG: integrase core domain-containing protein [Planctomycetota bacterium]